MVCLNNWKKIENWPEEKIITALFYPFLEQFAMGDRWVTTSNITYTDKKCCCRGLYGKMRGLNYLVFLLTLYHNTKIVNKNSFFWSQMIHISQFMLSSSPFHIFMCFSVLLLYFYSVYWYYETHFFCNCKIFFLQAVLLLSRRLVRFLVFKEQILLKICDNLSWPALFFILSSATLAAG